MLFKDAADVLSGEDSKLTHWPLRSGSQTDDPSKFARSYYQAELLPISVFIFRPPEMLKLFRS